MPDEVKSAAETTPPEGAAEETAGLLDFDTVMAQLDRHLRDDPSNRQKLASHQIVAGIAGGVAQKIARQQQQQAAEEAAAQAARNREAELLKLAEEDPEAFAARFATEAQAKRAKEELETLRAKERAAVLGEIGQAVKSLPGWQYLSPTDLAELAKEIKDLPDEQVPAAFTQHAVRLIARAEARNLSDHSVAERVQAERAAWEAEQATRVAKTSSPDLRRGAQTGPDEPDPRADPRAWNAWYEKNVLSRRR